MEKEEERIARLLAIVEMVEEYDETVSRQTEEFV
jgi:hypothetical protein